LAEQSSKIVIHTLSKGETFGWAPLCPVQIRTATVRVIDKADVIKVNGSELNRLFEEDNHIGYVVMKNLSSIISRRLDHTIIAFSHKLQQARMI
jgi:CRP/FNR family transcriptional regulator